MADVELEEGLGRPHQACNHVQWNTLCHSSQGYAVTRVSIRCTLVKVRCALFSILSDLIALFLFRMLPDYLSLCGFRGASKRRSKVRASLSG